MAIFSISTNPLGIYESVSVVIQMFTRRFRRDLYNRSPVGCTSSPQSGVPYLRHPSSFGSSTLFSRSVESRVKISTKIVSVQSESMGVAGGQTPLKIYCKIFIFCNFFFFRDLIVYVSLMF